jgi:hypothetical protein
MDLPKVLPKAWQLICAAPSVPIYTRGHESFGRLNHPSCWNTHLGLTAFFTLRQGVEPKPKSFWTTDPIRECTFAELMRDAWPHHYCAILDGRTLWNPQALARQFDAIMWDLRGWNESPNPDIEHVKAIVTRSIEIAYVSFTGIVEMQKAERT